MRYSKKNNDVYRKACLSKTQRISSKEKILDTAVNIECYAYSVARHA